MTGEEAAEEQVVVIGGGPAGLTAGYELTNFDLRPVVLEKEGLVGGLARTESYKGFHFDMGGPPLLQQGGRSQEDVTGRARRRVSPPPLAVPDLLQRQVLLLPELKISSALMDQDRGGGPGRYTPRSPWGHYLDIPWERSIQLARRHQRGDTLASVASLRRASTMIGTRDHDLPD